MSTSRIVFSRKYSARPAEVERQAAEADLRLKAKRSSTTVLDQCTLPSQPESKPADTSPVQTVSPSEEDQPMLFIELNIGSGITERVMMRENEDPEGVVEKIGEKHSNILWR